MVDTQLLDQKIEKSGLYLKFLIEKLGISRNGFDKKRKGKIPFRTAEIYVLTDLLNLSEDEKNNIFFADEVEE